MGQRLSGRRAGEGRGKAAEKPVVAKLAPWRDDAAEGGIRHEDISASLPPNVGAMLLHSVLSPSEAAAAIVAGATALGFPHTIASDRGGRNERKRLLLREDDLTTAVWDRVRAHVPPTIADNRGRGGGGGGAAAAAATWGAPRINNAWRFCRYEAGQQFTPHVDSVYKPDRDHRSFLTVMLYLDGDGSFGGGATNFLTWRGAAEAQEDGAPTGEGAAAAGGASRRAAADERYEIIQSISPAPGLAIIFDYFLFHEGASVVGFKHIIRSDRDNLIHVLAYKAVQQHFVKSKKTTVLPRTPDFSEVPISTLVFLPFFDWYFSLDGPNF